MLDDAGAVQLKRLTGLNRSLFLRYVLPMIDSLALFGRDPGLGARYCALQTPSFRQCARTVSVNIRGLVMPLRVDLKGYKE